MTWRDQLQPGSFRGIAFETDSGTLTAGRRLARHEYPQRDIPYMEDMGRRAREYKVEAYIIGPDYMSGRDQLLAAVEEEGAGQLVHRYHGTKLVTVSECQLSESTEFGGMAKFTLAFVEAGEQQQPTVGIDSEVQLVETQELAYEAIADDFSETYSTDGLPSWGLDDITKSVSGFVSLDDFILIGGAVSAFTSQLGSLLSLPGALASQLIGLIRSLGDVTGILDRPDIGRVGLTGTRSAVQRQQSAVSDLIKRAALVHQAGVLSNGDLATSMDVQAARAEILNRFDAHDYAVGTTRPSPLVESQLKAVRTAALANLSRQNAALPQTYELQLIETQPSLAMSYALYCDLRGADIVRRNAIRHPGFLPAGVPLQLTAE